MDIYDLKPPIMPRIEQKLLYVLSPGGGGIELSDWLIKHIDLFYNFFYLKNAVLNHCYLKKNKKTGFLLRKVRYYSYTVIFNPLKISSVFVEYLPRAWFSLHDLLVFFSSLAMIYHLPSVVFAFGNLRFWPYGKTDHLRYPRN